MKLLLRGSSMNYSVKSTTTTTPMTTTSMTYKWREIQQEGLLEARPAKSSNFLQKKGN